jgi:hypothetical protein
MRPIRFSNFVLCPNCGASILKLQVLPSGRLQCLRCAHMFLLERRNPLARPKKSATETLGQQSEVERTERMPRERRQQANGKPRRVGT